MWRYIGDAPKQLYKFHKKDLEYIANFSIRIFGLLFGWFVLLFVIELFFSIIFKILGVFWFAIKSVFYRTSKSSNVNCKTHTE